MLSSPSKQVIISESLSSVNEGIRASNLGRNVSLTWRYLGHIIRKCFSSSISCRSKCLQILCSRSIHVCLCLPLSISRSWSLNLYLERICSHSLSLSLSLCFIYIYYIYIYIMYLCLRRKKKCECVSRTKTTENVDSNFCTL